MSASTTEKNKVIRLLFDEGEGICVGDKATSWRVQTREQALELVHTPQLICSNPLDTKQDRAPMQDWHKAEQPRRADANVTAYRNIVLEFDGMPLNEQKKFLDDRHVPYSTLTYSGGKSLHAVVCFLKPFTNKEEYQHCFQQLADILLWKIDPSCKNPSRLTRLAGAMRNGVKQELLYCNRRIGRTEFEMWTKRFKKHLKKCEEFRAKRAEIQQAAKLKLESLEQGFKQDLGLSESELAFLQGEWNGKGSRHSKLVALTHKLKQAGTPYEEANQLISTAHEKLGIERDVSEAERIVSYVYKS